MPIQVEMTLTLAYPVDPADQVEPITMHESLYIIEINRLTNDVCRLRERMATKKKAK